MGDAQAEMNAIMAERKIMTALTGDIPLAANCIYKIEEEVLVYSENEKKWTGKLLVVDITGRMITLQTTDRTRCQTFDAF